MKSKQVTFFATKEDIISITKKIEKKFEIQYIEMGMFDSKIPNKHNTLDEVSNLGFTNFGNWISLDNRFMIINKDTELSIEEVFQKKGGIKYVISPKLNPNSIEFSTGGIYTQKDNYLIAGRVATVYDNDFSNNLYQATVKEIKKEFIKIESSFVGKEAYRKLKIGWHLVTNESSPKEYDLTYLK